VPEDTDFRGLSAGRFSGLARYGAACRLSVGLAGLAFLSACASGGGGGSARTASAPSTNYYVAHAAGNYTPPGPPSDPWGPYVQIAASRFDVPTKWIRDVMHVESGGHEYINGQLTVSGAGAMGLMQLEPETYQEMADRYGLGADPFNPYDNIMAGTAYIHEMYEVYGDPGFLAAYNAGPGRLDSFMNYNKPLPDETTNYVAMIAPDIQGYYPAHRSEADQLALNTEPMGTSTGILPRGYNPDAPAARNVEVAYAAPSESVSEPTARVAPVAPAAPEEVADASPPPSAFPSALAAQPVAMPVSTPAPVQQMPHPSPAPSPQPSPAVPVEVAALTSPSPVQESAVYTPRPTLSEPPAPPPPAPRPSFSLIQSAVADTPPPQMDTPAPVYGHAGWAIQVGAYSSRNNAQAALGIAELSAVQMLMHGQPRVVAVSSMNGTHYRARVTGLAHEDAVNACQRLSTGPTGCVVLSPEVQS
jgi:cell division protein FtsN